MILHTLTHAHSNNRNTKPRILLLIIRIQLWGRWPSCIFTGTYSAIRQSWAFNFLLVFSSLSVYFSLCLFLSQPLCLSFFYSTIHISHLFTVTILYLSIFSLFLSVLYICTFSHCTLSFLYSSALNLYIYFSLIVSMLPGPFKKNFFFILLFSFCRYL